MGSIAKLARRIRRSKAGNAAIIVGLGMPVLIGGAGFAVDTAQWYLWKRELQFAADQAAIAGAWARSEEKTEDNYEKRAGQEFAVNLDVTDAMTPTKSVQLADWNGGDENSVLVTASTTGKLPFSSFITGRGTTVSVVAQARFEEGKEFKSCIIATDEDDDGAITISGTASLTAKCGIAALSKSANAIRMNGNPTINAGNVLAAGGIDMGMDNGNNKLFENLDGLYDPYEELTPPDDDTPQEYGCTSVGKGKEKVSIASLQPGTYDGGFDTKCDTTLASGIYVIDGGRLKINAQEKFYGNGVMFVLKNGAHIEIEGGAEINLTAMNVSQLVAAGVDADEASELAGMLIFEDPESEGSDSNKINGNAKTVLNGTVYLPKSHVSFKGTAKVTSQCFTLAASTIDIGGTADMSTFCPNTSTYNPTVAKTERGVRLVG